MPSYTGTPQVWTPGPQGAADFNREIHDPLAALTGAADVYTPTLSGWTKGAGGTVSGRYALSGKWCDFAAWFVFGSGSAAAATSPVFTLPVAILSSNFSVNSVRGMFSDASPGATYNAAIYFPSTTQVSLWVPGTNGVYNAPSTTSPFTWTTGDSVIVCGRYETA